MDKRKYLDYIVLSLFLNLLSTIAFANSPWLPEKGKYEVALSTTYIDDKSKDLKATKIKLFKITEERIDELIQEIMLLEKKSYKDFNDGVYDAVNIGILTQMQVDDLKREIIKGIPRNLSSEIKIKIIEKKAQVIANARKKWVNDLKNILCGLSAYQQKSISTGYIEYAPRNNMSFGVKGYYEENSFTDSKYTSTKSSSNVRSAEVFYKYKFFQNKNFVLTLQPKFIFNNHSNFGSDEIFHELDFLVGLTKKLGNFEIFTQMSIGAGGGASLNLLKRKNIVAMNSLKGLNFLFE